MTGSDQPITVDCWPADDGWQCHVAVGAFDDLTEHDVTVSLDTLGRLAPEGSSAEQLLHESFRFLLEREPRESILRSFALTDIARYFPEYEDEISRRLG